MNFIRKGYLNIALFVTPLFVIGLINILNTHKPVMSEVENRMLKAVPKFSTAALFSGKLFSDYEDYFADTFSFRESLVNVSAYVKSMRGFDPRNGADIILTKGGNMAEAGQDANEGGASPSGSTSDRGRSGSASFDPVKAEAGSTQGTGQNAVGTSDVQDSEGITEGSAEESRKGSTAGKAAEPAGKRHMDEMVKGMLVLDDAAMEVYHFGKPASDYYASAVNQFQEKVGSKVKVYSMLAPTLFEFVGEEKYRKLGSSQKDAIGYINSKFNAGVTPINVYDSIGSHSGEYVYFRTDHHWTALGAYYAYSAFMEQTGRAPVGLDKYKTGEVKGFLGTTYYSTLNKRLRSHPDTITYYIPFTSHSYYYYTDKAVGSEVINLSKADDDNKYRIFLGGDRALAKITTNVRNNKKLLVVKDSYGNALIPFLIPHYQDIYIVDPRSFGSNLVSYVNRKGIQEVLFVDYIIATAYTDYSDKIRSITEM